MSFIAQPQLMAPAFLAFLHHFNSQEHSNSTSDIRQASTNKELASALRLVNIIFFTVEPEEMPFQDMILQSEKKKEKRVFEDSLSNR